MPLTVYLRITISINLNIFPAIKLSAKLKFYNKFVAQYSQEQFYQTNSLIALQTKEINNNDTIFQISNTGKFNIYCLSK